MTKSTEDSDVTFTEWLTIRSVLIRYCSLVDEANWSAFDEVFVNNGVVSLGDFGGANGLTEITSQMRIVRDGLDSSHHTISNEEIRVEGDEAFAVSRVDAVLAIDSQTLGVFRTGGVYRDRFVLTEKGWRIAYREFLAKYSEGDQRVIEEATKRAAARSGDLDV